MRQDVPYWSEHALIQVPVCKELLNWDIGDEYAVRDNARDVFGSITCGLLLLYTNEYGTLDFRSLVISWLPKYGNPMGECWTPHYIMLQP